LPYTFICFILKCNSYIYKNTKKHLFSLVVGVFANPLLCIHYGWQGRQPQGKLIHCHKLNPLLYIL
jgi:hypothetical protein